MTERAARYLAGLHITTMDGSVVSHEAVAYTVLGALEAPTKAMEQAGYIATTVTRSDEQIDSLAVWTAMIKTALAEGPAK